MKNPGQNDPGKPFLSASCWLISDNRWVCDLARHHVVSPFLFDMQTNKAKKKLKASATAAARLLSKTYTYTLKVKDKNLLINWFLTWNILLLLIAGSFLEDMAIKTQISLFWLIKTNEFNTNVNEHIKI